MSALAIYHSTSRLNARNPRATKEIVPLSC
jgi:hypothetical protein